MIRSKVHDLHDECCDLLKSDIEYVLDYPFDQHTILFVTKKSGRISLGTDDTGEMFEFDPDVSYPYNKYQLTNPSTWTFTFTYIIKKLKYQRDLENLLK